MQAEVVGISTNNNDASGSAVQANRGTRFEGSAILQYLVHVPRYGALARKPPQKINDDVHSAEESMM